jgi:two-component system cell cycle response regulator
VATYPDQADSPSSLIRHADRAMYMGSKRGGRNRVSIYQAG